MGIVYVLINPAFEGYVKIGKTTDLVQRLKSLDNTSVPLPFRCVHAVEVDDMEMLSACATLYLLIIGQERPVSSLRSIHSES